MSLRTEIVISDRLKDFGEVWIKCPSCNLESPYRLGHIRYNPNLTCQTCWTLFVVDIVARPSAVSSPG